MICNPPLVYKYNAIVARLQHILISQDLSPKILRLGFRILKVICHIMRKLKIIGIMKIL